MSVAERLDKHDRQIASIRDLVKEGMRMVVETRRLALETRKDLRSLAAAQKRTEESLRALIDSLHGGGNGHTRRRVE
jgi:hypothetical protein